MPDLLPTLSQRFRILRRLGSGGMGVVYEAEDLELGQRVALKTLRDPDREGLYRLKREFRTLADLSHPHLVTYYDLVISDEQCFFTMELLEGVDVLAYCRADRAPGFDEARLRLCLGQLAEGLTALHAAGKLHCDVKPSNVLVSDAGRLVLLDFGVARNTEVRAEDTRSVSITGTVAYMSPEQAAGEPVLTPASDSYSVGVLLYRLLCQRLPFEGSALDVLQKKQHSDPPPPRAHCPLVPPDLDALCVRLLARNPRLRAGLAEIRSCVAEAPSATPLVARQERFVGRTAELSALASAYQSVKAGQAAVRLVHGVSGMGKSALVRQFVAELRRKEADLVVLEGRCYEREEIPYKAIDTLVDHLHGYWKALVHADAMYLLPREAELLPRLFPVLARVPVVASAPKARPVEDPQELRARAMAALREVFERLSSRRRVVVVLDDMQWVDRDSVRLLEELLSPPDPPSLLAILCSRDPVEGLLHELLKTCGQLAIALPLGPLPDNEARKLAQEALSRRSDLAGRVAYEAGGSPFFIEEIARYLADAAEPHAKVGLELAVAEHVAHLSPPARHLVELVAVAGEPVSQRVLTRAAERPGADVGKDLRALCISKLLRAASDADRVEPYHDRIRESVTASLAPDRQKGHHLALAQSLDATEEGSAESLARHWHAAGESAKAVTHARRAADLARAELAFDHAARLYRFCVSLSAEGERLDLQAKLGEALALAGRGKEAADAYLQAAVGAERLRAIELKRCAAGQLLQSGHIDQGLVVAREVLRAVGLRFPRTLFSARVSFVCQRIVLAMHSFRHRAAATDSLSVETALQLDTLWAITVGLMTVEPSYGADFHTRYVRLSLRLGDLPRVERAVCSLPEIRLLAGWFSFRAVPRRLARLRAAMIGGIRCPYARAWAVFSDAVGAWCQGEWRDCARYCSVAETLFRDHCTGASWEISSCQSYAPYCHLMVGAWRDAWRALPGHLREASDRSDLMLSTYLGLLQARLVTLLDDEPEFALAGIEETIRAWPSRHFSTVQHCWALLMKIEVELYRARGAQAWNRINDAWPMLRSPSYFQFVSSRVLVWQARAYAALAAAHERKDSASLLRIAEKDARRIEREGKGWGNAFAALIRAAVAQARGNPAQALLHLGAAETSFAASSMAAHLAATQYRRGQLLGGDEGQALIAASERWMSEEGVKNPTRVRQALAPGRWE